MLRYNSDKTIQPHFPILRGIKQDNLRAISSTAHIAVGIWGRNRARYKSVTADCEEEWVTRTHDATVNRK